MAPVRRRERHPGKTRASLLAAAIREFSRRGYGGGRIDRIAHLAKTNKQSIYRYFGNKRGLFSAALEEGLISRLREVDVTAGTPMEQVTQSIQALHELLQRNPELSRLLLWEMLEGVRAKSDRRYGFVDRRRAVLERGRSDSSFDPHLDVDQALVDISALSVYPFVMVPAYRIVRDRSPYTQDEFAARLRHVQGVLRILLSPRTPPDGSRAAGAHPSAASAGPEARGADGIPLDDHARALTSVLELRARLAGLVLESDAAPDFAGP